MPTRRAVAATFALAPFASLPARALPSPVAQASVVSISPIVGREALNPVKRDYSDDPSPWVPLATHGLMVPNWSTDALSPDAFVHSPIILPSHAFDNSVSLFSTEAIVSYSSPAGFPFSSSDTASFPWERDTIDEQYPSRWKRAADSLSRDFARRDAKVQVYTGPSPVKPLATAKLLPLTHLADTNAVPARVIRRHARKIAHKAIAKAAIKSKVKAKAVIDAGGFGKVDLGANADISAGATISTAVTWYSGNDLKNPYCDRKSHWTPTDHSLIVAVTQEWSLRPKCGDFVEIGLQAHPKAPVTKSVVVRVVDLCGGCKPHVAHADLSKAAFSRLLDLNVGVKSGLLMRKVTAPSDWDVSLYGPKVL